MSARRPIPTQPFKAEARHQEGHRSDGTAHAIVAGDLGLADTTAQRWLDPVLGAHFHQRDGLHGSSLDPSFVDGLDELWRRLALLGQALPDDPGGNRVALTFNELTSWLAGIYCTVTVTEGAPISMREPFFPYVAAVVDLLKGARPQFPKAVFDLPPSDEALRKALGRTRRTQPTT